MSSGNRWRLMPGAKGSSGENFGVKKVEVNVTTEALIRQKLMLTFEPTLLEVVNESHGHNVAPGSETHFKVVIVANLFSGCRPVQRHRQVYAALEELLKQGIHALAIHTYTPEEWLAAGGAPESPECLGGSKR
jgi:stress-induced morphogen